MIRNYFVYIMTNKGNNVLYTGITNNLLRRQTEHQYKLRSGFTSKYRADKLVYYEVFTDVKEAILREKQIKAGSRRKKLTLVNGMNPEWKVLSLHIFL